MPSDIPYKPLMVTGSFLLYLLRRHSCAPLSGSILAGSGGCPDQSIQLRRQAPAAFAEAVALAAGV